jgi:hypothetical protein
MKIIFIASFLLANILCIGNSKKDVRNAFELLKNTKVIIAYDNISFHQSSLNKKDSAFCIFGNTGIHSAYGHNYTYIFKVVGDSSYVTDQNGTYSRKKFTGYYDYIYFNPLKDIEELNSSLLRRNFRLSKKSRSHSVYTHNYKKNTGYLKLHLDSEGRLVQIVNRYISKEYDSNDSTTLSIRYVNEEIPQSYFKTDFTKDNKNKLETTKKNYYPFSSLNKLDSLTLLSGTKVSNGRRVVIYGYMGCAPCHILKNYLMEIYQGLDVSADQVIVVNNHDKNSEILSYIERKGIPFSYYKSDTSSMSWSAPTIGFYDESGQLVKADFGGSKHQARIIAFYLSGRDKLLKQIHWELD